ncbi:MAG: CBS domain-containing protein [bacterium]|nr:CBS domain-containing protein [bacterium]MCP4968216.1 CBS domain-containing protein [bacterium]
MRLHALVGGTTEIVGPESSLADAAEAMADQETDYVVVIDNRELVGILTERDIVVAVSEGTDLGAALVEEWMSEAPDTFKPDVTVAEGVAWLLETGYRHLPVMADSELLGVVTIRDLMWAQTQQD